MAIPWREIVLDAGLVNPDQLARLPAASGGEALPEALVKAGLSEEVPLYRLLADRLGLEFRSEIDGQALDPELMRKVPMDFCQKSRLVPLAREADAVMVATTDPLEVGPLDDLRVLFGSEVRPVVAAPGTVARALQGFLEQGKDLTARALDRMPASVEGSIEVSESAENLLDAGEKSPVVVLVRSILFDAIQARASDVHIEPFEKELKIRYRIDGILYETPSPPKRLQPLVISRVKILAGMDIAESRLPQDGRIPITAGSRKLDIRVSTLPTAYGERVVMRILDKSSRVFGLPELGFAQDHQASFATLIEKPHGIVLVTGPTGSGKSTTLYAALSRLASTEVNIITVEDPIENEIPGVGQVQVKPGIGLTFAEGLRSILRQDPDIIMVGEIRDRETAEIAVQASLTGHMVFSTLHTNDAAGGFTRLIEMGVEPYLIASSVLGVVAQRLVRRVCPSCRSVAPLGSGVAAEYGIRSKTLHFGKGCASCRSTGYSGRVGIFELLEVDDRIRDLIIGRRPSGEIKDAAVAKGMRTLREDGILKVELGETTLDEVARTTAAGAVGADPERRP